MLLGRGQVVTVAPSLEVEGAARSRRWRDGSDHPSSVILQSDRWSGGGVELKPRCRSRKLKTAVTVVDEVGELCGDTQPWRPEHDELMFDDTLSHRKWYLEGKRTAKRRARNGRRRDGIPTRGVHRDERHHGPATQAVWIGRSMHHQMPVGDVTHGGRYGNEGVSGEDTAIEMDRELNAACDTADSVARRSAASGSSARRNCHQHSQRQRHTHEPCTHAMPPYTDRVSMCHAS